MGTRLDFGREASGAWGPTCLLLGVCLALSGTLTAQGGPSRAIASLHGVAVPQPTGLDRYVTDQRVLVALGKALFWDVQVSSDGRTACATCHFHAGADHRIRNQLAGPQNAVVAFRANLSLGTSDFPFHAFENALDNRSTEIRTRREVVGSAGIVQRTFVDVIDGSSVDSGADLGDPGVFSVGGLKVRQVTARNTPSVINAVFYVRNFWDGRASNLFTGATPFGDSDRRATVLVARGAALEPEIVRVDNASLASQAVGPPLNAVEMSFDGRSWARLGRKMLTLTPLGRQQIAQDDSVLGPMSVEGPGVAPDFSYAALVRSAFRREYWGSAVVVDANGRPVGVAAEPSGPNEFTQMAYNFALFFGLAVQAYEATLVADDTRVDRFLDGQADALSALEEQGLNEFRSGGSQCTRCHQGPELSAAGFTTARNGNPLDPRDLGFFRTGVSAVEDDIGASGTDGFGLPIFPASPTSRGDGAFKSPGLRNVELTGPYFHTGGSATLEQVIEFYARNGDVPAGGNLGPGIGNIRLNAQDRAELVAFLKALTDDRVRFEQAPFDHPALCVPVGYPETSAGVLTPDTSEAGSRSAADQWALVPAVGRGGSAVPLQTFEEQLTGIGRDASRAHALERPCSP
jgi:cytochrome c peroxidase